MAYDYRRMLRVATHNLRARSIPVATREQYWTGNHPCQLGTQNWNTTYRKVVSGIIDNQCQLVVTTRAEAIAPIGVEPLDDDPLTQALAIWATDWIKDNAEQIAVSIENSKWSGVDAGVIIDYDTTGNVVPYPHDPRSLYVHKDTSGSYLWAVHFWQDPELDPLIDQPTMNATIYTPEQIAFFTSASTFALPNEDEFRLQEEYPNVFQNINIATVDERRSLIDMVSPQNDMLNKSLQTQSVVGEAYAVPFRVWLGIENYNAETGEITSPLPDINPVTGSRDVSIATAQDAEGANRQIIQLPSPAPEAYLMEQDALRAGIARLAKVPAFMLQLGSPALSGDAMEIAYMPHIAAKEADERLYRQTHDRMVKTAIILQQYKLTGRVMPAPRVRTVYSTISTSTRTSRVEQLNKAVQAGMTLADALVEFMGYSREAADETQAHAMEVTTEQNAQAAQMYNAGVPALVPSGSDGLPTDVTDGIPTP